MTGRSFDAMMGGFTRKGFMRIRPDTLADKACWISDDRIYALVTSPGHGVSEIGYHGRQPVSRNSRMLAHPHAVLECFLLSDDGTGAPIPFDDLEWSPGRVVSRPIVLGQQLEVVVQANSPALALMFSPMPVGGFRVMIRYRVDSIFTDVQGERHWMDPSREGDTLLLSCRDRIVFDSWIRRTGPYGGDFLIPEVWRRKLFQRHCRSGEATLDDVRPEYRDAALPLYDASLRVSLGGEGFTLAGEEGAYLFTTKGGSGSGGEVVFTAHFADEPPAPAEGTAMVGERGSSGGRLPASTERPGYASLQLPDYPRLEEFFGIAPELV
ncbi:MAG: hypothetical protein KAJ12_12435, partial [Bacteroidetes bacterium]|nr:hypothetical protein [Bacteroidota bacterium]